ncbi:MAG: GNAT family N-acetyltransferase [Pseudomonadales bacterium]
MKPTLNIRIATMDDCPRIAGLMEESVRVLAQPDYPSDVLETALRSGAWGLDTQLIKDETFYLVFVGSTLAGCGSWSFRRTLFGSDTEQMHNADRLDPKVDAARIRAFFVHPHFARHGIGSLLLTCCEKAAQIAGFHSFTLAATLPGKRLYRTHGYMVTEAIERDVGGGLTMRGLLMTKRPLRKANPVSTAVSRFSRFAAALATTSTAAHANTEP